VASKRRARTIGRKPLPKVGRNLGFKKTYQKIWGELQKKKFAPPARRGGRGGFEPKKNEGVRFNRWVFEKKKKGEHSKIEFPQEPKSPAKGEFLGV